MPTPEQALAIWRADPAAGARLLWEALGQIETLGTELAALRVGTLVLREENRQLREEVQTLREENRHLRERLVKDSHNSSKLPSSDGAVQAPPEELACEERPARRALQDQPANGFVQRLERDGYFGEIVAHDRTSEGDAHAGEHLALAIKRQMVDQLVPGMKRGISVFDALTAAFAGNGTIVLQ